MNYPSQEELLNDVASLMQQMRRFKIDCEAKSDPKTEGKQVEKYKRKGIKTNLLPDHKDQVDLGESWVVPVLCRNRAAERHGGAPESCLVCQRKKMLHPIRME